MIDNYIYPIVALLPLSALMLVLQQNPYHALVIRAILGAIAALVYVVLGAADVALTEALVGTMLAVTLYAIAVRSSLVMKLGIVSQERIQNKDSLTNILAGFRKVINKHHLRLELVEYPDISALDRALLDREVHATIKPETSNLSPEVTYQTNLRVNRLFQIMQTELVVPETTLAYVPVASQEEKH